MVITSRTRNAVVRKGSWVRIPPLPPKKHCNFDTMGIRIAVLSFCPEALISRASERLLSPVAVGKAIACRLPSPQRRWAAAGYRLFYGYRLICGLSFSLLRYPLGGTALGTKNLVPGMAEWYQHTNHPGKTGMADMKTKALSLGASFPYSKQRRTRL